MNTDLLNILKQIVAERGESILSEPKEVSAFFSDLARDVPKPQKNALIKCLEHNFAQTLRNVGNAERANCKQKLAEKLHNEEGLDIVLCGNAIELLGAALFGEENTFTDPRDGKVYRTVKIGEQIWMAENLAYEHGSKFYRNGEYGRLYDWETAMKACPPGWHLPSNEEWQALVDFVGGREIAGKKLKTKSGWKPRKDGTPGDGTDDFGFAALPGGYRHSSDVGDIGYNGSWWSSSTDKDGKAYRWYIYYSSDRTGNKAYDKNFLHSVRYIKNTGLTTTSTAQKGKENNMEKTTATATATTTEFGEHGAEGGSADLQKVFKEKPWQIQCPEKAKIIFLSLDANWPKAVEEKYPEFFKETLEYLEDGVNYIDKNWEENKVHTPMLKKFYNGEGIPYHRGLRNLFQELNFTSDDVKNVCLLELLNVCTYGRSQATENIEKYKDMLKTMWNNTKNDPKNEKHKERIQKIFKSENNIICIVRTVKRYIEELNEELKLGLNLGRENIIEYTHFSDHYHHDRRKKDTENLKVELRKFFGKK